MRRSPKEAAASPLIWGMDTRVQFGQDRVAFILASRLRKAIPPMPSGRAMFALSRLLLLLSLLVIGCSDSTEPKGDADTEDLEHKYDEPACDGRADGYACGEGAICLRGMCGPSVCGDGYVDASRGEDCDDANAISGDGCENDCRFSCSTDADCQDGNFCNGEERCIEAGFGKLCVPSAAPLNCNLGEVCTLYSCNDEAETLEEACVAEPIDTELAKCWRDADDDGYPTFAIDPSCDEDDLSCANGIDFTTVGEDSCACPEGFIAAIKDVTAKDCDDEDPLTYPGAPELCGNRKDNNCDGKNESTEPTGGGIRYYCSIDADQDGYPDLGEDDQLDILDGWECVCPEGTRAIDSSRKDRADCDPSNKDVNPGITKYSDTPYCPGEGRLADWNETLSQFKCSTGVTPSFDFNCDGDIETSLNYPTNFDSCPSDCFPIGARGWIGDEPECGETGELRICQLDRISLTCNEWVGPSPVPLSCR